MSEIGSEISSEAGMESTHDEAREKEFKEHLKMEMSEAIKYLKREVYLLEVELIKSILE